VVGDCAGGEGIAQSQFTAGWDLELAAELFPVWLSRSLLAGRVFDSDELVHLMDAVLRCGASAAIPSLTVIPRQSPQATSIEELQPEHKDALSQ